MLKICCILQIILTYTLLIYNAANAIEPIEAQGQQEVENEALFVDLPDDTNEGDLEEDMGEKCEPNKPNPCESEAWVCTWIAEDLEYRCSRTQSKRTVHDQQAKRRRNRRKKIKEMLQAREEAALAEEHTRQHTVPPPPVDIGHSNQKTTVPTPKGRSLSEGAMTAPQISIVHTGKHNHRSNAVRVRSAPISVNGTIEVPKYQGTLTWDGKSEGETCLLKHKIAEALQGRTDLEKKEEWVNENKDQICDFTKFFHCTIELPEETEEDDDYGQHAAPPPPGPGSEESTGVCRCYESSMAIVRGVCYIPAGFGTKSNCDNIYAPYPVKRWKGAPPLQPKCTPNSDCKESQYWFGKRCVCHYTATYNPTTHACDDGSRLKLKYFSMFTSLLTLLLAMNQIQA